MKYKKFAIASAFLLAALTAQLQAQEQFKDWLGVTSTDWVDSSNWESGYVPGTDPAMDTARIYNNTSGSDSTDYNTVLKTGDSVSLNRVWLGNSNDVNESGVLTVETGATLTTAGDFVLENNSSLTSSGEISVGNGNGLLVRDNANVTLNNGATLNAINLNDNSTATLEAGSTVTTIKNINNSAQLTLNNTYTGNMFNGSSSSLIVNGTVNGNVVAASTSSITVNGTVNGNFGINSTSMQTIGENGTVNGTVEIADDDKMTVAGNVNGRFFIKSSAQVIIEPTANVLSNHNNSWIYDTPTVTWKVGADGSIGTLRTNRGSGDYTAEWRYANSDVVVVVDLTDCEVYGSSITLQLVSGIQNEENFANKVTFLYDGEAVTGFTWDGAGTGSFSGTLSNPEPDADGDGVADNVDAFPNDPTESVDTDGDNVGDNADEFPNDDTETVDTDGDGVGDNGDVHPGYNDTQLTTYLSNNNYIVDDGTSGGIAQSVYDAAVAAQATAEAALANAREARAGSTVIDVANDLADITLRVEQTSDVSDWSSATSSDHTIQLSAPAGASFYRFTIPE